MSGRVWHFLSTQWDALITVAAAVGFAVVTILSWIGVESVSAATLTVLALLCFTIVNDRQARAAEVRQGEEVMAAITSLDESFSLISDISAVAPNAIRDKFAEGWRSTTRWRFKGGTGTYLRAQTLPGLALRGHPTSDVWVEILAPDDHEVCDRYGAHRRRGPNGSTSADRAERWSTEAVRIESYATIIAAIWYTGHMPLRVHVALTSTMSTLRYDLCDSVVIVTNEDPGARALAITGPSSFFDSTERELKVSFEQARQLDIGGVSLPRKFSADDVRGVLGAFTGPSRLKADDAFLTYDVLSKIALKAISKEHAPRLGFDQGGAEDPYPADRR